VAQQVHRTVCSQVVSLVLVSAKAVCHFRLTSLSTTNTLRNAQAPLGAISCLRLEIIRGTRLCYEAAQAAMNMMFVLIFAGSSVK